MTQLQEQHVAVVGLGFGDEGKGSMVDWLCATRSVEAVVRFNGGAQAGHNVVLPSGRHHTFSQWGSGTFRGVPTFLSRYMIIDPHAMFNEAFHLRELGVTSPWEMLYVDNDALIATPYHVTVNHAREIARGTQFHGSVGMGVGETVSYALGLSDPSEALVVGDLRSAYAVRTKLKKLSDWCQDTLEALGVGSIESGLAPPMVDSYDQVLKTLSGTLQVVSSSHLNKVMERGPVVFEGAQGVLLDEWFGFHPYTTWSTTTFNNINQLTEKDVYRIGVLRTYTTRHGPGPLPTEDASLQELVKEPHNGTGRWQGNFRIGHFDAVAHQYAVKVCGRVDGLALTHIDIAELLPELRLIDEYTYASGTHVNGIAPSQKLPDSDLLVLQEKLTEILMKVRISPTVKSESSGLWEKPSRVDDWAEAVSKVLQVPVVVTSHGPLASDKKSTVLF